MRKRVLVAMSGGVDSSVASHLLIERGFEVAGLTMCFGIKEANKKRPACCGREALEDAKKVCRKLKIPHYVIDFSKHLEKEVIKRFVSEYRNGRTPNPCVDCNQKLKFDILLKKALSMGFDYLATGHYARIKKENDNFFLEKAKDRKKDQSYFLYCIGQKALRFILFPLGGLTKGEVRHIAKKAELPVADKPQSQDICFIPRKSFREFLIERTGKAEKGPILDLKGNMLGEHKGAIFYTIGQRGGLGIGYKHPLYVLSLNTEKNRLIVGEKKDLKARGLIADEVNLLVRNIPKEVFAKIRYNHSGAECKAFLRDGRKKLEVIFKQPQEAITPGQSVVLYDRDIVLGGGVIEQVIR